MKTIQYNSSIKHRALIAYIKSNPELLSAIISVQIIVKNDLKYVLVRDNHSPVQSFALYRVRNDGMLKRLKRFPHWTKEREH
jgi:hypothetical protein